MHDAEVHSRRLSRLVQHLHGERRSHQFFITNAKRRTDEIDFAFDAFFVHVRDDPDVRRVVVHAGKYRNAAQAHGAELDIAAGPNKVDILAREWRLCRIRL